MIFMRLAFSTSIKILTVGNSRMPAVGGPLDWVTGGR